MHTGPFFTCVDSLTGKWDVVQFNTGSKQLSREILLCKSTARWLTVYYSGIVYINQFYV